MNLESTIVQVHIEDIIPNRFQPRLNFDEQGLKELSDSIKEHGIIQPLVLRKLGNKYEIIAGERRYKASQMAGLTTVPAVIANIDDNKSAEVALVENVQRRDLTAIEEARSYKNLLDKEYLTQEQLAKRMGLSQPAIANKLRLLNLDEEVQQALLEEKISERHARTLLTINNKNEQKEWLHRIINERLTVRQLDLELKKIKEPLKNEEDEEVPIVPASPSVSEIIASSSDLNETKKKLSLDDLMQPQQVVNEVIETLDTTPSVEPKVESFTTATKIPEFNIATPNSASTLMGNEEVTKIEKENSKFFDFGLTPTEPIKSYDNFNNTADNTFIDMSQETEIVNNQEEPEEIQNNPLPKEIDDIDNDFITGSNNKFFTLNEESSLLKNIKPKNESVNPMDVVDKLTPEYKAQVQEKNEMGLKDAITNIRTCIEDLGKKGFFIDVEEIDFTNSYEIKIDIHKDN